MQSFLAIYSCKLNHVATKLIGYSSVKNIKLRTVPSNYSVLSTLRWVNSYVFINTNTNYGVPYLYIANAHNRGHCTRKRIVARLLLKNLRYCLRPFKPTNKLAIPWVDCRHWWPTVMIVSKLIAKSMAQIDDTHITNKIEITMSN